MILKQTLMILSVLSLSACQTTGKSADEVLFQGLADQKNVENTQVTRKAEDPVCVRYYANATQYVASANKEGLGSSFLKTLALGTLAGAASGGVGSLGISSSFLELALAGAANQVVFQGGQTALKQIEGDDSEKEADAIAEIDEGAKAVGCPKPQRATAKAAKEITSSGEEE